LVTGTALFSHFTGVPDTPENRKKFISNVPMGRICEVEDVANACLFMASDEAKFISKFSPCMRVEEKILTKIQLA